MDEDAVRRPLVGDGVCTKTMEALTGGAVLAGLALHLGASDLAIGVVAALPLLAQLAQVPFLRVVFWLRDRKRICVVASLASRLILLAVAALAFVGPTPASMPILFALLLASSLLGAAGGVSWNYWMRDLVPRSTLGRIFASRLRWQGGVSVLFIVVSGVLIDRLTRAGDASVAYALLFVAGAAAGLVGLAFIRRVPDAPLDAQDAAPAFLDIGRSVWAEPASRRPILFAAWFGFATTMAFPFVTVFMLVTLGLPFWLVAAYSALSLLASIVVWPLWGSITDRFGNKPAIAVAVPALVLTTLALTLLEDGGVRSMVVLGVVHVVNGIALAATELATANLVLKAAPERSGGAFLAVASAARSLAAGAGALVSGALAGWAASRSLAVDLVWSGPGGDAVLTPLRLGHYDALFLASALLLVYTLHRLALVKEEGEAPPAIVLRELQLGLQGASSVLGARTLSNVGAHITRHVQELRTRFL